MEAGLRFDRDGDNDPPKKMSISEGLELGLITPEKAQELKDQTPPCTEFTPLYVVFRPTQSIADGLADARNIGGRLGVPQNVRDADALAQTIIENLQPGVVPIFVGHSMGGMLARAVGTKHNYASIGFNPLGLGRDVRKFINKGGSGRCKQANDAAHAECHPSFVMRGDWVSDSSGSLVARAVVKKSDIGQSYIMEDRSGATGMFARHNAYARNISNHFENTPPENPPPQNG
jgi:pimeloyl-ACP methyl ester carboxylesterase